MRYLFLIASLALAANALAEEKPKSVVKELDKSTPILMEAAATPDSTDASSAEERGVVSPRDAASGMPSGKRSPRDAASGMPTGKRSPAPPAEGADYNSSRSNKTHSVAAPDGGSGAAGGTRAQDYNSSRSNTTTVREDKPGDLDRDGQVDVLTCGDGIDNDCDDGDDPVVRKKPWGR